MNIDDQEQMVETEVRARSSGSNTLEEFADVAMDAIGVGIDMITSVGSSAADIGGAIVGGAADIGGDVLGCTADIGGAVLEGAGSIICGILDGL